MLFKAWNSTRPKRAKPIRSHSMGLSLFQTSTLGMKSQAHALNTIGTNIANISTGGFKRTDTRFVTVLSGEIRTTPGQNSTVSFASQDMSLGGVRPIDFQIIDQQGRLQSTERDLDLAIAGDGFFQVSPTQQISGEILFTRDGSFEVNFAGAPVSAIADDGSTISVRQGFLTDKNGFFLLGVAPLPDGTFSESSSLQALRVDQFAISNQSSQTTTARLGINLPANKKFGEPNETTSLTIVDSNGKVRALTVTFVKTPTTNQWQTLLSADNLTTATQAPGSGFSLTTGVGTGKVLEIDPGTGEIRVKSEQAPTAGSPGAFLGLKGGDSITLAGSPTNDGTFTILSISSDFGTITVDPATPLPGLLENFSTAATLSSSRVVADPLIFGPDANLISPLSTTINLTWDDGATNSFAMDLTDTTQFAGGFVLFNFSQNGLSSSSLENVTFDDKGHVIGGFKDGTSRKIYKLPLATFSNPNGLEFRNGNAFAESDRSGTSRSVFADTSGIALLAVNTVELSNVDLASQFTQMILVQQAYNSSATVIKTVDEMLEGARDLKT